MILAEELIGDLELVRAVLALLATDMPSGNVTHIVADFVKELVALMIKT